MDQKWTKKAPKRTEIGPFSDQFQTWYREAVTNMIKERLLELKVI